MPNMNHGKAAQASSAGMSDPYPCTLHGGAIIERTPTGYRARGGPVPADWRLAFYHGVWHATRGQWHFTAPSLGECLKAARSGAELAPRMGRGLARQER